MRIVAPIIAVALFLASAGSLCGQSNVKLGGAVAASSFVWPEGRQSVTIPIEFVAGKIVVGGVTLNGRPIGNLILDTGASWSLIDASVAEGLRLPLGKSGVIRGAGGEVKRRSCWVDVMEIHGIRIEDHRLYMITDPAFDLNRFGPRMEIVGLLGNDFLSRVPFTLDLESKELTIHARRSFRSPADGTPHELYVLDQPDPINPVMRANPFAGQPAVRGAIDDGIEAMCLLDTGSDGALDLTQWLTARFPEVVNREQSPVGGDRSVIGRDLRQYATHVARLTTLGQRFDVFGRTVAYAKAVDSGESQAADEHRVDAIIGLELLRRFRLTFDYANGRLWTEAIDPGAFDERIESGLDLNARDAIGDTPLHRAARWGDVSRVGALLAAGADPDRANRFGQTPLLIAAPRGHTDASRTLADAHGDGLAKQRSGRNLLHLAAYGRDIQLTERLIAAGLDVYGVDARGRTPLHIAADRGYDHIVDTLLKHGTGIHVRDRTGATPLLAAARRGYSVTVRRLLEACSASGPNLPSGALHAAAGSGSLTTVVILLGHGANVHETDVQGRTALHIASRSGARDVVEALVDASSDPAAFDARGETPLTYAAAGGSVAVIGYLLSLDVGVDRRGEEGARTALIAAAQAGHLPVAAALIDAGAQADAALADGRTALFEAAAGGHADVLNALLQHGANPDVRHDDGSTPLIAAVRRKHPRIVNILLGERVALNVRDSYGRSAMDWALTVRNRPIINLLLHVNAE